MIRFASWFCYSCVYDVQLIGETWDLYDTHGRTKKTKTKTKTKTNEKRDKKKKKKKNQYLVRVLMFDQTSLHLTSNSMIFLPATIPN